MLVIDRIKALSKEKGIKQMYICEQLGLHFTYLNNVKKGKDKMTDERLAIIAGILDTTPEYLKGETEEKEKPIIYNDEREKLKNDINSMIDTMSEEQAELYLKLGKKGRKIGFDALLKIVDVVEPNSQE